MKNVVFLIVLSLLTLNSVRAQTQSRANSNDSQSGAVNDTITIRSRVVGSEKVANYVQRRPITAAGSSELTVAWGNSSVSNSLLQNQMATSGKDGSQLVQQTSTAVEVQDNTLLARLSSDPIYPDLSVYRVGVGDVLDIRLLDLPSRESTLFTVLKGSLIEYPLVSEPLSVAGLTAEQIAVALAAKIKVIRSPRIIVTVRDYASHAVMITGLVDNPGRKILRREALPLYALLAEALPRPDAFSVTVTRAGGKIAVATSSKGAVFTVTLPIAQEEKTAVGSQAQASPGAVGGKAADRG